MTELSPNAKKLHAHMNSPTWRRKRPICAKFAILNPGEIFGMVGRCGGGYNTVWTDWSSKGRQDRELIMAEFEEQMNKLVGHYDKLEKSILKDGLLNPLIITCGYPLIRKVENLPPEIQDKNEEHLLLLEGGTGGSRLWVAQKHNIPVPCIINDTTKRFKDLQTIYSAETIKTHYMTPPNITLTPAWGFREVNDSATHIHLDAEYKSDKAMVEKRAIMYYKIMKKHGRTITLPKPLHYLLPQLENE